MKGDKMELPNQFRENDAEDIRIYHYVEELVGSYKEFMSENWKDDDVNLTELPFLLRIRFTDKSTQKDLVHLFQVSEGYTAKLLRRFEDAGLITRMEDPSNHRIKIVNLTKKGEKTTDRAIKFVDYWENFVSKSLDDDEVKVLKKALFKVVKETENL